MKSLNVRPFSFRSLISFSNILSIRIEKKLYTKAMTTPKRKKDGVALYIFFKLSSCFGG